MKLLLSGQIKELSSAPSRQVKKVHAATGVVTYSRALDENYSNLGPGY
jgi:hypothetical protein